VCSTGESSVSNNLFFDVSITDGPTSGEERWRSEGIQVGGVRSARGVIGTWFDKDFEPTGPAGPTAFWKIGEGSGETEDSEEEEGIEGHWHV
jgi:hypothetical protein